MRKKLTRTAVPIIVGTGLVTLDIVIDGLNKRCFAAGGTCANVMIALSYLGWKSVLVSRLGIDSASDIVLDDLETFGVDTTFAKLKPQASTPVIVQRITVDSHGDPYHTFSFSCPSCGRRLPSYQPVSGSVVREMVSQIKEIPTVVFVDRISRGSIDLASSISDLGGIVVFEPSSLSDEKLFREMLDICHVIKYSHECLLDNGDLHWSPNTVLEIQTLGRGGVRHRYRDGRGHRTIWHHSDALPVPKMVDTCGAGDWFSAGLIHRLCRQGKELFSEMGMAEINRTVAFAQRLSSWNCGYIGARGGMYSDRGRAALRSIARLQNYAEALEHKPERDSAAAQNCGCNYRNCDPGIRHTQDSTELPSNADDRMKQERMNCPSNGRESGRHEGII
jgi:fructokinase